MEASKFDSADMEGQFAKPDIFAKDGVTARMDNKFPFHPLERSEAKYELTDNFVPRDVIQYTDKTTFLIWPSYLQVSHEY